MGIHTAITKQESWCHIIEILAAIFCYLHSPAMWTWAYHPLSPSNLPVQSFHVFYFKTATKYCKEFGRLRYTPALEVHVCVWICTANAIYMYNRSTRTLIKTVCLLVLVPGAGCFHIYSLILLPINGSRKEWGQIFRGNGKERVSHRVSWVQVKRWDMKEKKIKPEITTNTSSSTLAASTMKIKGVNTKHTKW